MGLLSFLKRKIRATSSAYRALSPVRWMNRDVKAYADEGYSRNVIVFRCIEIISKSAASVPLMVMKGDKEVAEKHPLVQLLKRPNPMQGGADFMQDIIAYHRICGNSYMEALGPDNPTSPPNELWPWQPYNMKIVVAKGSRIPELYCYDDGEYYGKWEVDELEGKANLLHWKTFNPLNRWLGMSPIAAAAYAVDQHNSASEWNQRLLQNAAEPSAVLSSEEWLTDDQYKTVKDRIEMGHEGPRNARKFMFLEGGLTWTKTSLSPAEMDWLNGRNVAARDIAGAFGVPTQVIPIQGDQTFANYEQARLALWEDTVIPLMDSLLDEWNNWLVPRFGDGLSIVPDWDSVPALAPRRAVVWAAVQTADWLTINEKREATGYDKLEIPEADEVYISSGLLPLSSDPLDEETETEGEVTDDELNDFQKPDEGDDEEEVDPTKKPTDEDEE